MTTITFIFLLYVNSLKQNRNVPDTRFGLDLPDEVPMKAQERAYISLIWYTPWESKYLTQEKLDLVHCELGFQFLMMNRRLLWLVDGPKMAVCKIK